MYAIFLQRLLTLCCCLLLLSNAIAGPGAHGPNGEHLDAPSGAANTALHPKFETHSELFELVAELESQQLRVYLDRYLTNDPVLQAQLTLEIGKQQSQAKFEASSGSYLFTDTELIQQLQQPGEHALVFTLLAGEESDLLEGSFNISAPTAKANDHTHPFNLWQFSTAILTLLLLALLLRRPRATT